jgi:hypothetical protein
MKIEPLTQKMEESGNKTWIPPLPATVKRDITPEQTRKNCFRYLKLMSPLNVAICTTISYTL